MELQLDCPEEKFILTFRAFCIASYFIKQHHLSPEYGLVFRFIDDVGREALEEARILPFVDGTEDGGRGPAPGVHHGAVRDPYGQVPSVSSVLARLYHSLNQEKKMSCLIFFF